MKDLCKRLRITSKLSTAHHLQTDGQTEQINHDLQQYLYIFTVEKQNEWTDWIALPQFFYNTKQQSSTKKSPFKVTHMYSPRMGIEKRSTKAPAVDLLVEEISNTLESVKKNLKQAQDKMKSQGDKHRSNAPIYQPGDQVWLSTDNPYPENLRSCQKNGLDHIQWSKWWDQMQLSCASHIPCRYTWLLISHA